MFFVGRLFVFFYVYFLLDLNEDCLFKEKVFISVCVVVFRFIFRVRDGAGI